MSAIGQSDRVGAASLDKVTATRTGRTRGGLRAAEEISCRPVIR